jgi:hypothetical protein
MNTPNPQVASFTPLEPIRSVVECGDSQTDPFVESVLPGRGGLVADLPSGKGNGCRTNFPGDQALYDLTVRHFLDASRVYLGVPYSLSYTKPVDPGLSHISLWRSWHGAI